MAREKRSMSLSAELAEAIDEAAADGGTTFGGSLAEASRAGDRQTSLSRLLAPCEVEAMTDEQAHV